MNTGEICSLQNIPPSSSSPRQKSFKEVLLHPQLGATFLQFLPIQEGMDARLWCQDVKQTMEDCIYNDALEMTILLLHHRAGYERWLTYHGGIEKFSSIPHLQVSSCLVVPSQNHLQSDLMTSSTAQSSSLSSTFDQRMPFHITEPEATPCRLRTLRILGMDKVEQFLLDLDRELAPFLQLNSGDSKRSEECRHHHDDHQKGSSSIGGRFLFPADMNLALEDDDPRSLRCANWSPGVRYMKLWYRGLKEKEAEGTSETETTTAATSHNGACPRNLAFISCSSALLPTASSLVRNRTSSNDYFSPSSSSYFPLGKIYTMMTQGIFNYLALFFADFLYSLLWSRQTQGVGKNSRTNVEGYLSHDTSLLFEDNARELRFRIQKIAKLFGVSFEPDSEAPSQSSGASSSSTVLTEILNFPPKSCQFALEAQKTFWSTLSIQLDSRLQRDVSSAISVYKDYLFPVLCGNTGVALNSTTLRNEKDTIAPAILRPSFVVPQFLKSKIDKLGAVVKVGETPVDSLLFGKEKSIPVTGIFLSEREFGRLGKKMVLGPATLSQPLQTYLGEVGKLVPTSERRVVRPCPVSTTVVLKMTFPKGVYEFTVDGVLASILLDLKILQKSEGSPVSLEEIIKKRLTEPSNKSLLYHQQSQKQDTSGRNAVLTYMEKLVKIGIILLEDPTTGTKVNPSILIAAGRSRSTSSTASPPAGSDLTIQFNPEFRALKRKLDLRLGRRAVVPRSGVLRDMKPGQVSRCIRDALPSVIKTLAASSSNTNGQRRDIPMRYGGGVELKHVIDALEQELIMIPRREICRMIEPPPDPILEIDSPCKIFELPIRRSEECNRSSSTGTTVSSPSEGTEKTIRFIRWAEDTSSSPL